MGKCVLFLLERLNNPINHDHCIDDFMEYTETSSLESLSMDMRVSIIEYLSARNINSLMRTNQNNLYSCKQYIHRLLSHKFSYLLNVSNAINIKHLLRIPLVDSIKMNVSRIPFYFGQNNETSSKYIGLDIGTNNAFISFCLLKVQIKRQLRILTFVFNETNLESIYLHSFKIDSLNYKNSDLNDIKAINKLLLNGKIKSILGDSGTWCLNDQWMSLILQNHDKHRKESSCCYGLGTFLAAFIVMISVPLLVVGM